jgi:hypothetical protein
MLSTLMIKAKVIDILRSLSKEELKWFGDYLSSPLFNKRETIAELLGAYKKYYPGFDDKNFTKEKIHRKLFPGKPYNDEVFRNLNSQLLKQAEEFLSYLRYSSDGHSQKKHLLNELLRRKLHSLFEKNLAEALRTLESGEAKDHDYFSKSYEIYLLKDIYNSFRDDFDKQDIQRAERDLLVSFVMKILEIQNYVLYESRLLRIDRSLYLSDKFTENLMKHLPEDIKEMPQVKIHFNAFMLEKTDEEKYFTELHRLVAQHGDLLEKEKRYNKYVDLIDHLKRTRSMNDPDTLKEVFQLRKEIVEKGLYMENFITNMFFLNMVKSGSRLKEFDWVKNFIENYNSLLTEDYRHSTLHLALAIMHFEMKKFGEALSNLSLVRYEDSYYNLEVRNLTSRIYYEMGESDLLIDFLNSYRIYLSKNRVLSKKEIESHNHFVSVLGKMLRIRESGKSYKLDELMPAEKKKEFISKAWILEKMKELDK